MTTKRISKQKSYTLYPEQFAKLDKMFRRTYRNDSETVRHAIDRLFDHPEEWLPVNPKVKVADDESSYAGTA